MIAAAGGETTARLISPAIDVPVGVSLTAQWRSAQDWSSGGDDNDNGYRSSGSGQYLYLKDMLNDKFPRLEFTDPGTG